MDTPLFLTLAEVIEIHKNQIDLYGGDMSIRDIGLLQSALAQPSGSFSGQWLHGNIFLMSAAYAFHICQNHAFIDGNKRTALASALVFLEMNNIEVNDSAQKLFSAMLKVSQGKMQKEELAQLLEELA